MSSKCDWTVTLWIIVSNLESRFRITVLSVLKETQKESHKIQVSFENSCSCLTQATEATAPATEAAFSWFSIGEKGFAEVTSVVHDELTFCQMDSGVLME